LEYNYLRDELKMSHDEAWEKCRAIVVHGDLLAKKSEEEADIDE